MRTAVLLLLAACQSAPALDAEGLERTATGRLVGGAWEVRADGLTVRVDRLTRARTGAQGPEVVARGRTSRAFDHVFSWVPDDAFGTATQTGVTRFELDLDAGYELNSILSGLPLMVQLHTPTGRVRDYNAWVGLAPELLAPLAPPGVTVEPQVQPVYVRDPVNTLRYRATIAAPGAQSLTVQAPSGAAPAVHGDGVWQLDWTYDALALAAGTTVTVDGAAFTLQPRVVVSELGLTTEDPYLLWSTACEPAVLACMTAAPGTDLGGCGTWREVSRCASLDVCATQAPGDLTLVSQPLPGVEVAAQAWNDAAYNGGVWGSVEVPAGWSFAQCEPVELEALVAEVIGSDQNLAGFDFAWGSVLDRAGLAGTAAFGASYSPEGPALLAAIEAAVGSQRVEAWVGESEIPCPNCHEWADLYVLYYPDVARVVVITATHGWDS